MDSGPRIIETIMDSLYFAPSRFRCREQQHLAEENQIARAISAHKERRVVADCPFSVLERVITQHLQLAIECPTITLVSLHGPRLL
jgi:hypothetical protein